MRRKRLPKSVQPSWWVSADRPLFGSDERHYVKSKGDRQRFGATQRENSREGLPTRRGKANSTSGILIQPFNFVDEFEFRMLESLANVSPRTPNFATDGLGLRKVRRRFFGLLAVSTFAVVQPRHPFGGGERVNADGEADDAVGSFPGSGRVADVRELGEPPQ